MKLAKTRHKWIVWDDDKTERDPATDEALVKKLADELRRVLVEPHAVLREGRLPMRKWFDYEEFRKGGRQKPKNKKP